jgi:excisionase family DNA binding protein
MSGDRLLTADEVADLLQVKVSWVREATRDGRLPHICLGRYRRYRRTEILSFIEDQRRGPLVGRPHR